MREAIVSADDHLDLSFLPKTLWQDRLPKTLREIGPKVSDFDGVPYWEWEGKQRTSFGVKIGLIDGFARAGMSREPEPGVYRPTTPRYRLADMDLDGVAAQVLYPPPSGISFNDPTLGEACFAAYNDWVIQDFCAASPDRLIGLAFLPMTNAAVASAELKRVAALGARGAIYDPWLASTRPWDDAWEPFWACAEDVGLPIHIHIGGGLHSLTMRRNSWETVAMTSVIHMQVDEFLPGLVFCGLFERYPKLKVVLAESGIGWVPYVLEVMKYQQKEWAHLISERRLPRPALEYFRENMFVTFEQEWFGVKAIPEIGPDNVLWSSDYPHGVTTWPNSQRFIDDAFAGMDPEVRRKVTRLNSAKLYRIDLAAAEAAMKPVPAAAAT